jgi:aminoglycoside/choline kinase family phosphotransferase
MPESIVLQGVTYSFVTRQRGSQRHTADIYRSEHTFLRIGDPELVMRNLRKHQEMEAAGFPVPRIVATGELDGRAYFIEDSLGNETFRQIFDADVAKLGSVSEEHFEQFIDVVRKHLTAQVHAKTKHLEEDFRAGLRIDALREELPQYAISLDMRFKRVLARLADRPFVLSHGDLGPANMTPLGIIDLEDTFAAPFGFDAVSALVTIDWFPESNDYEYFARYRFSNEQRARYLTACDEVAKQYNVPPISTYFEDFELCRAAWLAVGMDAWPKIQKWRYDKFIKTYLFY